MSDLIPFVIHEQQQGQLCAQHALNNMLQGEYYTAPDLASIAQTLDDDELATLLGDDLAPVLDAEKVREDFAKGGSNNYDDSGFFSVQVRTTSHKLSI